MKDGITRLIEDLEDKKELSYKFFFEAIDRKEMQIEIRDKMISDLKKKITLLTKVIKL